MAEEQVSSTNEIDLSINRPLSLTIEDLLAVWPILSSLASHSSAGDLISLSRTSSHVRALLHEFGSNSQHQAWPSGPSSGSGAHLHIGEHQTPLWANLKSLAAFTCSSSDHRDPKTTGYKEPLSQNPIRPCNFCSLPVCRICIVRSFFQDPNQSKNTFRYRTRYLCQSCWDTGNLREDFRYPLTTTPPSRERLWYGRGYGQRGSHCTCLASEDNWLCRSCRSLQNQTGPLNLILSKATPTSKTSQTNAILSGQNSDTIASTDDISQTENEATVPCYGLSCKQRISLVDTTRDRRRICLWCSKRLARPYGGKDRHEWEEKQLEIRAAAAASRSADIAEWARNRFRTLTISRRELRGTEACVIFRPDLPPDSPEHDKPIFVRHLDAVNYRAWMDEHTAPSPDAVYQSKHQGRWTYSRQFLRRIYQRCQSQSAAYVVPPFNAQYGFTALTRENGLPQARTNYILNTTINPAWTKTTTPTASEARRMSNWTRMIHLAAQFHAAGLITPLEIEKLSKFEYDLHWVKIEALMGRLCEQWTAWEEGEHALREPVTFEMLLWEYKASVKGESGLWKKLTAKREEFKEPVLPEEKVGMDVDEDEEFKDAEMDMDSGAVDGPSSSRDRAREDSFSLTFEE